MAEKLKNPLAEPVKKEHKALEFEIQDVDDAAYPAIDKEDDFDVHISDDDDFDI